MLNGRKSNQLHKAIDWTTPWLNKVQKFIIFWLTFINGWFFALLCQLNDNHNECITIEISNLNIRQTFVQQVKIYWLCNNSLRYHNINKLNALSFYKIRIHKNLNCADYSLSMPAFLSDSPKTHYFRESDTHTLIFLKSPNNIDKNHKIQCHETLWCCNKGFIFITCLFLPLLPSSNFVQNYASSKSIFSRS